MIHWLEERLGVTREVLALSLARLGDGIGNSILIVVIPLYVAKLPSLWLDLPEETLVGFLIGLYGLVNTATQPLAGAALDRWSRHKASIQGGLALMAASTLALLFAERYLHLVILRSLQGVGFALTLPASLAILKSATRRESRGGAMGFFTTFRMVGFSIGPLLGGFLQARYGFAAAFWAGTASIVAAMACVQLWVEEPEAAPPAATAGRIFDRELLTAELLALAGATFVMAMGISMMSAVENEMNLRLHQTALGFGVAFSALTVTRILSQVPLGRLSDRVGRRPVVIAGLLFMAPATALLGFAGSTLQLAGVRLFQGLGSAAIAAPAFALAVDVSRRGGEGRQLSLLTMGFGLGIAAGPLLAGLLAPIRFELPFVAGGLLCLAAAWLVRRAVRDA
ncbi:MAG: MFS transporter [Thermoanaerobaculia bacterium]